MISPIHEYCDEQPDRHDEHEYCNGIDQEVTEREMGLEGGARVATKTPR